MNSSLLKISFTLSFPFKQYSINRRQSTLCQQKNQPKTNKINQLSRSQIASEKNVRRIASYHAKLWKKKLMMQLKMGSWKYCRCGDKSDLSAWDLSWTASLTWTTSTWKKFESGRLISRMREIGPSATILKNATQSSS